MYAYYFEHQLGCVVHIFIHKAEYGVVNIHTAWPNACNSSKQISCMRNPKVILNSLSLINECILQENSQYVIFITESDYYYALTNLNANKATGIGTISSCVFKTLFKCPHGNNILLIYHQLKH